MSTIEERAEAAGLTVAEARFADGLGVGLDRYVAAKNAKSISEYMRVRAELDARNETDAKTGGTT